MIVYVESNFVLEVALEQEQSHWLKLFSNLQKAAK